jgi:hypothetical protein
MPLLRCQVESSAAMLQRRRTAVQSARSKPVSWPLCTIYTPQIRHLINSCN